MFFMLLFWFVKSWLILILGIQTDIFLDVKTLATDWGSSFLMLLHFGWCGQNSMNSLSEWMWRYGGEREMICDIIPIFLAARSGIKLCCTAVNRPWNNHNLFHRRALETCQPGWRIRPDLHSLLYKGLLAVLESIHQTNNDYKIIFCIIISHNIQEQCPVSWEWRRAESDQNKWHGPGPRGSC